MNNAFALSGRLIAITFPRALPWAKGFWAFSPRKPFDMYGWDAQPLGAWASRPRPVEKAYFFLLR